MVNEIKSGENESIGATLFYKTTAMVSSIFSLFHNLNLVSQTDVTVKGTVCRQKLQRRLQLFDHCRTRVFITSSKVNQSQKLTTEQQEALWISIQRD